MDKDQFLSNLQYHMEGKSSLDWEVDWEDAPLPYKLYRDLPSFPFSSELPFLVNNQKDTTASFQQIGNFLWYVYGLSSFSESILSTSNAEDENALYQSFRRFVPSGGALYPNELYIYLKIEEIPTGIYHYDVAHHRLVLLREGNYDTYIEATISKRSQLSTCFGVVFISTMFWKNFFKYHHFAYRLQALDTGVLMGQLLEVAKSFQYKTTVFYQFLDRAVNHLMGIDEKEESIYSIIPLSLKESNKVENMNTDLQPVTDTQLINMIPSINRQHYCRSRKIKDYSSLLEMNRASMFDSTLCFQSLIQKNKQDEEIPFVSLPTSKRVSINQDLASVCRGRFSPEADFTLKQISMEQLATLFYEAFSSCYYHNDLQNKPNHNYLSVAIYGCFYNIENLEAGSYRYDLEKHALILIKSGDHRLKLQQSLAMNNVNLFQVPLNMHIMGEEQLFRETYGYRGYRIMQMEAGMLVQRLLLTGGALGLGGHPLLGYNARISDQLYSNDNESLSNLIQIPMGNYRPRAWLKGSLIG